MCEKGKELNRKQQICMQVSWYVGNNDLLKSQYGMLEAFMINFSLIIFCCLEAMLTDRLRRKSTSKKKTSNKSYEEFHSKIKQISEENVLYPAK